MSYILTLMPCCEDCPEFEVDDYKTVVDIDKVVFLPYAMKHNMS